MEKNNLDKYTGILFELKIGLNKNNAIVIDYGGKPVGKIRDARESQAAKTNPYFDSEELVENKYYQFKGAE